MDGPTVRKWYLSAKDDSKDWREEAREMYDLVAGHQYTETEEADLKSRQRIPVTMNRIGPYVDMIQGQEINNRQELKFLPRETTDTQVSDMLSEASRWADDQCDAEDENTDAFGDMVICGMGWTETRMDYADGPEGMLITAERIDPMEMYWDTRATKRNLTDSRFVIRAKKVPEDEAEERWPKIKDIAAEYADSDSKGQPHDAQNAWKYERTAEGTYYPDSKEYLILQCQYYKEEKAYKVLDPDTGQLITLPAKRYEAVAKQFKKTGIELKGVAFPERKYYQSWTCGEEELQKEDGPSQKGFTLRPMCAKRDRNKRNWYGIVRSMKDPQKFSNKFFSDILYILATNRKGGVMVETGAAVDARKFEDDYADPAAVLWLKDGSLARGAVKERDAGVYPQGLDRLMSFAITAIPDVSGISQELLGMADRTQPGVLEAQRKQSSLTILAPLFNALRRHTKERGRVVLDMIQRFLTDGRIIRITGPDGQQVPMPLLASPETANYDIVVDQAATTPNSKEQTFAVLQQMLPFLSKMGVPIPPSAVEYLPLPATLVSEWKDMLAPKEPQPPSPEQQAQMMEMQSKQQDMQAQQQQDQVKMRIEVLKMEHEKAKAQLDMQLRTQEAQLRQQEMQMDAELKRLEMAMKAQELEGKREEFGMAMQMKEKEMQVKTVELNRRKKATKEQA